MMTIANTLSLTKPDMNTTNCDVWMLSKVVMGLSISRSAGGSFETSTRTYEGLSGVTTQGEEFLESRKKGSASNATLYHDNRCNNKCFGQPFGSMPRFRSSSRPSSFNQLLVLVFASCAKPSNCLRKSAGMRIGSIGDFPPPLGCLSLVIDMHMPIALTLIQIGIYTNTLKPIKTTPRSAGTHAGRLTTNATDLARKL